MSSVVARHLPAAGSRVMDVGCGDGWLAGYFPQYEWHGVEPDPALRKSAMANGVRAVSGRAEELPYPDGHFDAVCMFDVLEHLPDDGTALAEARRVLRPGGLLFASVPLHPRLWSAHDEACGHYRRYRKGELERAARRHGFVLAERRFFVSLFLPAAALARAAGGGGPSRLPGFLDILAERALSLDARLRLPFGLSEVAVFERLDRFDR
ncbi:class I SAM-dependent methyltransferase [Moorella sp. E308F]|uniref:class I SAM-dependent methyltransferase n=1 Tax=Moorella sp. E308F TaxID=2572682 RepID=UPI00209C0FF5|nr:class I SAM-dependent methyltransferase [Moorella sp. E308F]